MCRRVERGVQHRVLGIRGVVVRFFAVLLVGMLLGGAGRARAQEKSEPVGTPPEAPAGTTSEEPADQTGAGFVHNPKGLASALRKLHTSSQKVKIKANPATAHMFIVNPLSAKGFTNLFSTHPPMEERIARLEGLNTGIPA